MTNPFRLFRRSELYTECEECRSSVDLSRAGACSRCRRILCNEHLHGTLLRRLLVDLGVAPVCLTCRQASHS